MAATYELYVMTGCPFCAKVLSFMKSHAIEIPIHDVDQDDTARATLQKVGGKVQCPCLFIDGKPLYESGDIIAYLEEHAA